MAGRKTKNTRPNRSCLSCIYSKREHTKTGIVVKCEISTLSKTVRIKSPWTPCEWFKFIQSARPEIDIHSRATAVFGVQKQLNKVAEECSELAAAINKYLAGECSQSKIVEEAAAVKFCLGYLELWFGKKEIEVAEQKKKGMNMELWEKRWLHEKCVVERKDELIEQMQGVLSEVVTTFIDTQRYPDPETVTTGLRILLPKMQSALEAAERKK